MRFSMAVSCVVAGLTLLAGPAASLKCFRCSNDCDESPGKPVECPGSYDTCLSYSFPGLSEKACWQKSKCDINVIIRNFNPLEWNRINATIGLTPANKDQLSARYMSCCDDDLCNPAATAVAQPFFAVLLPIALFRLLV